MLKFLTLAIAICASCTATQSGAVYGAMASAGSAVVTCSRATCGGDNPAPACVALEADVFKCLTAIVAGDPSACIATAPSAVSVGVADLVCVLSDLVTQAPRSSPTLAAAPSSARALASRVLARNGVTIATGAP